MVWSCWQDVFPLLELEGEYDPLPRMNALMALAEPAGVGRALRDARLLEGVHGQISLRDAETLLDGSQTDSSLDPGGRTRLQEALKHAFRLGTESVAAVSRALAALQRIRECTAREAGGEWAPDYSGLERSLGLIAALAQEEEAFPASFDVDTSDIQETASGDVPQRSGKAVAAVVWRDLVIDSREDALLALDKVCSYFDAYEPSHPAPLLIRRVQQTVPLNFHELLKDLAPQGADQFTQWMPRGD